MNEVKTQTTVLERAVTHRVRVEILHPNTWNPNRQAEFDHNLLIKGMERSGFTTPVLVRPHPSIKDEFQILDGFHRWKAWSGLGNPEIDIIICKVDDAQARLMTMQMNNRGNERADRVADLFRELAESGHIELMRSELMMDDVEVSRMLETIRGDNLELDSINITPDMLGPEGHGLGSLDVSQGIDLTADEKRAKQRVLDNMKADEEKSMEAKDRDTFRLVLVFTGPEADVVKSVLDELTKELGGGGQAEGVLKLCRESLERSGAAA